jgi:alpha-tubulin suppressor-like RCC1 family protein
VKTNAPKLLSFPSDEKIIRVQAGGDFSTALTEKGSLYIWGYDYTCRVGPLTNQPSKVTLPSPIVQLATGWCHILALTESGDLYAWGKGSDGFYLLLNPTQNRKGSDGELGLGDQKGRVEPVLHPLKEVKKVVGGDSIASR